MSISPINFNGMIQNTNEVSHTKASEDQKPQLQQDMLTNTVEKMQEQQSRQVNDSANSKRTEDNLDREGNGSGYQGNKNGKRPPKIKKGQKLEGDGKVEEKTKPSFDMRI